MKKFIGTKIVMLEEMNRRDYNVYRGWDLPSDENGDDEGYLVEYVDGGKANDPRHEGYISWSPKKVADKHYRPVDGMTFGMAIEAAKIGHKISRKGWNGKGMFVYYVPPAKYPADRNSNETMVEHADSEGMVQYNAYLAIKNVDGAVSTWVPSVNDVLSDDWDIV